MTNTVYVLVSGGNVQIVAADDPENIRVVVIDDDNGEAGGANCRVRWDGDEYETSACVWPVSNKPPVCNGDWPEE